MLKLTICVILCVALCAAEPPRYRSAKRVRVNQFLLRQEAAPAPPSPQPTGYPAAGVTPEVPFELPSESDNPEVTYLPPDNAYGPPNTAEAQPELVYGAPANTYGPPEDTSVEEAPIVPTVQEQPPPPAEANKEDEILVQLDDGTVIAVATSFDQDKGSASSPIPARLVYQRFPQGNRAPAPIPARLAQFPRAPVFVPAPAKLQLQPQSFSYTSRFETW